MNSTPRHPMRIVLHLTLMIVAAGIGLAVGYGFRGKRAPAPAASPAATTVSPGAALSPTGWLRSSIGRAAVRRNDDSPLATQLERDLSMSSGVTRWLYWLDALERAAPSDFPRLLRLAQDNPAAVRLVQARWIEIAPRHLFDTIVSAAREGRGLSMNETAHRLFDEWPKRDPDAAIAALNEVAQLRASEDWRWTVAYGLVDKDIERGLRLMVEWHAGNIGFGPRGIAAVKKWTRADPRHAAEVMLGLSDGYTFRSVVETIGQEWARIDPAAALDFAASKPGELASLLATHALKDWAERNLTDAADWLSGTDDRTRRRLSPTFVEAWAKQDATGALSWCEENLTGSALAQSVAGVVKGAAEKDVAAAAALVSEMNPSPARNEAAAAVAQKWFPKLATDGRVGPETVAWLARLDRDSLKRVMDQVTWGWATTDPGSMAAFLATSSSDPISTHAYTVAGRELARRDPASALQWASRLSGETALTAGGAAFAEWRASQPEAAAAWLNNLPATDPRRQSYFEGAIRNLAYHPQVAEQFNAMSPTERAAARNVIATMKLSEERRAQLLNLLKPR